jgi:hypothetical protein
MASAGKADAVEFEVCAELAPGPLEPAVEDVDGVLARVRQPHCAERVLHDRPQERNRCMALACSVQGADGLDQVDDVERRSPPDHGRPVHAVDLTHRSALISAFRRSIPAPGSAVDMQDMLPQASGGPHPIRSKLGVTDRAGGQAATSHPPG